MDDSALGQCTAKLSHWAHYNDLCAMKAEISSLQAAMTACLPILWHPHCMPVCDVQQGVITSRNTAIDIKQLLHLCPVQFWVAEQPHTQDSASPCGAWGLSKIKPIGGPQRR